MISGSVFVGYAITSGKFFNGDTYFAVGAPRDKLTGKVNLCLPLLSYILMTFVDIKIWTMFFVYLLNIIPLQFQTGIAGTPSIQLKFGLVFDLLSQ